MSLRNKLRQWLGIEKTDEHLLALMTQVGDHITGCELTESGKKSVDTGGNVSEVSNRNRAEYSPDQDGNVIVAEPRIMLAFRDKE